MEDHPDLPPGHTAHLFFDLRGMPVPGQPVSAEVPVHLRIVQVIPGRAPGPGNPDLASIITRPS